MYRIKIKTRSHILVGKKFYFASYPSIIWKIISTKEGIAEYKFVEEDGSLGESFYAPVFPIIQAIKNRVHVELK